MEVTASYDETGKINIDNLKNNLKNNLNVDVTNFGCNLPSGNLFLDDFSFYIDLNGDVVNTNFSNLNKQINSSNYGDYVSYSIDIDNNPTNYDWKIFYSNDEHIFIISDDYILNSLINTDLSKLSIRDMYNVSWDSIPNSQNINSEILNLFNQTWLDYDSLYNSRCVSTLLNSDNWESFLDNSGYGEYVIGSPTLEMFVESWNKKGYAPLYINIGDTGYCIGLIENPLTTYQYVTIDIIENSGYNDTLYFPHQTGINNCYSYWLATPSNNNSTSIMSVNYNGNISRNEYYMDQRGLRPVVCLNSNIKGTQNEDGIWILSN